MLYRVAFLIRVLGLATLLMPTYAIADLVSQDLNDSVIAVNAYRDKNKSISSGVVVQADRYNGYVVTNGAIIRNHNTLTVTVPGTGAELVAEVIKADASIDLVLLKVNGLNLKPMVFGLDSPQAGDGVWSAARWDSAEQSVGLAKGNLRSTYYLQGNPQGNLQNNLQNNLQGKGAVQILNHTANIGSGEMGSVLLNDCGQLIGFNMTPGTTPGTTLDKTGTSSRAIDGQSLAKFLSNQKVRFTRASTSCVSIVNQAKAKADQATQAAELARIEATEAQRVAKAMEARLLATDQRNQQLIQESVSARRAAEAAIQAAATAQAHADQTRIDLEKQTAEIVAETEAMVKHLQADRDAAEKRFNTVLEAQRESWTKREDFLIALFVGLLGILVIAIFLIQRAGFRPSALLEALPANPLSKELSKLGAKRSLGSTVMHKPDLEEYVLDGRDEDGIRYLLRISGDQLIGDQGIIIGRNPNESPYIINHSDVSRQHARLKVMKNRVFIEDLGSTNGTSVNGQNIDDKGLVSVSNGDQIIIGSVVMKLRVMGA